MPDCPYCAETLAPDGWCPRCGGLPMEEPPPGFRWVEVVGGPRGDFGRMLPVRTVYEGAGFSLVGLGETYVYDGRRFVYEGAA